MAATWTRLEAALALLGLKQPADSAMRVNNTSCKENDMMNFQCLHAWVSARQIFQCSGDLEIRARSQRCMNNNLHGQVRKISRMRWHSAFCCRLYVYQSLSNTRGKEMWFTGNWTDLFDRLVQVHERFQRCVGAKDCLRGAFIAVFLVEEFELKLRTGFLQRVNIQLKWCPTWGMEQDEISTNIDRRTPVRGRLKYTPSFPNWPQWSIFAGNFMVNSSPLDLTQ